MDHPHRKIEEAYMLVARLERLSADSTWAHRASGLRGSLLRHLEKIEVQSLQSSIDELNHLDTLSKTAFGILTKAASEIPDPDEKI
jgi:hypothetical protein